MGVTVLEIKENDLQPYYYGKVVDSDGTAVDLTGATIRCTMKNIYNSSLKIDRQTTGIALSTNTGLFQYQWQVGETDTPGTYTIEFEITPTSGGKYTVPPNDKTDTAIVSINESLDDT